MFIMAGCFSFPHLWINIAPRVNQPGFIPLSLDAALRSSLILDGGLGSELARNGCDVHDALWSGRVLLDHPGEIARVHRSYLDAGAKCLITASYQVSFRGFEQAGIPGADTEAALRNSVTIAQQVRDDFRTSTGRDCLIAASVGPFGAALADGSEFHGNYSCTYDELLTFHRRRISVLFSAGPDLLACETIPSLEEARAILQCLREHPHARAWFSFCCRDGRHISHGEQIAACARLLDREPQVVAIGINCTPPQFAASLINEIRSATAKPVVVYPNSGRPWDAINRCWLDVPHAPPFASFAEAWRSAGAIWIGGCCGTTPDDIRQIRQALASA